MTISYPLLDTTDTSTGIAFRRRASIVIGPEPAGDLDAAIVDAMKRLIRPGVECQDSEGRQHWSRFACDVAHLFVYRDPETVSTGLPGRSRGLRAPGARQAGGPNAADRKGEHP